MSTVRATETVPVTSLRPYAANPRNGDIDAIAESLRAHGQYRALVVNRPTMEVLAGNHTMHALMQNGTQDALVHFVEVDEVEAAKIVLADNRTNDLAKNDDGLLAELLQGLPDLSGTGYDDTALQELLARVAGPVEGLTDPDDVPAPPKVPVTQRGDLWLLGDHRLLCGDSTNAEDVGRLVAGAKVDAIITDPPYGIGIVSKGGSAGNFPGTNAPRLKAKPIHGDDAPFDPSWLIELAIPTVLWGGNHYADRLPVGHKWLVWDKKDGAFEGSDLGDCELAWTNLPGIANRLHHQTWQGMYRAGPGERSARVHPTQKPVALMAWCIKQTSGETILDPFGGSGTTLIAAHQEGRVARLCEIDPAYVDVTLRRFQEHTGILPRRENGGEHDFTAGA